MSINKAYDSWANQYDTNDNKTRDLEAVAFRENLNELSFGSCLEIGCGTGKNTEWLVGKTNDIVAVDFSEEMLKKAKEKELLAGVNFIKSDINNHWEFITKKVSLICFSLVLEHIKNLDPIFQKAADAIKKGGYVYIGELHPFKQYSGSKARFETEQGIHVLTCFNHHLSDFTESAKKYGFEIIKINEYFDNNDKTRIPRILTILLKKK